ncbi:response regulator receiver modulated diguanylate cyclase [Massilia sp. CF038]|nr:diguanylate cyclase [Massilia sp. CF038]SHG73256.1 response regulator receiver modulated diguanylate cyclase [Massilia sp. CF038]
MSVKAISGAVTVRVLVVDDQTIVVEKLKQLLAGAEGVTVSVETDGSNAVEAALAFRPTVILQDLIMPQVTGLELIAEFRKHDVLRDVPIVILSSMNTPQHKEKSFEMGADDYLVKLPDRIELLARLRYHSASFAKGLERDEAFELLRVSQKNLAIANVELQILSGQDGLTGLANRRRFDESLKKEWQRGCRNGTPLSLLMCDIDHFKKFNDSFGHVEGDLCLKRVAAVLIESLKRPGDLAARYGGEEFALLLPDTDLEGARIVADQCLRHLAYIAIPAPSMGEDGAVVTLSMGVASVVPEEGGSKDDLIRRADRALYDAKHAGRNRVACAPVPDKTAH